MTLSDPAYCRHIVRTHARTFWLASHFLAPAKRRACFALYAFCRVADDMVDLAAAEQRSDVALLLANYRQALDDALAGRPDGPVFRELARAATVFEVPGAVLHELLDGVARDCAPERYERWSDLASYCAGVASSVGEMCTYVFGVCGDGAVRTRALAHARILGVAMQLTNVLRDVGEDARNGRCYLPDEDLARFGLTRAEVLAGGLGRDDRFRALMAYEITRARVLYAQALPGIALLAADARRCALACAVGYERILSAIETIEYDTYSSRARLGTRARAEVLWNVWRAPFAVPRPAAQSAPGEQREGELIEWA